ncbi:MAG: pyruvate kinase [Acidobacteria bacterium]|nr:pyruvate kinase [Acidobacteriota bacterium]
MPRTRIICTIGPASRTPETMAGLLEAGMDIARLNFSHGSHREHGETITTIRSLTAKLQRPVAILMDLAGFKIRIGELAGGSAHLAVGTSFTLTTRKITGNAQEAFVNYPDLPRELQPGDTLLLNDGAIELKVATIAGSDVACKVIVGGVLCSRKGVSIPGRPVGGSGLTEKDKLDLAFGLSRGIDFVGLSFVRTADDVRLARQFITDQGSHTPIIAKIETQDALDNFDRILEEADAIMVARGDLGVGTSLARIPRIQKDLIAKSNRAAKPVITATDMLRSTVSNPRPTRAEVADVANSILDGTDAVMLSEETAIGAYPLAAVRIMSQVAEEIETSFPYGPWRERMNRHDDPSVAGSIAAAVCDLAHDVDAAAILTCTSSGSTARLVAKFRPSRPVLALTPRETTYRRLALTWGVIPRLMDPTSSTDQLISEALKAATAASILKPGDRAVITAGVPAGIPGNTNLIKVEVLKPDA